MTTRLVPRTSGGYYKGRIGDFAIRIDHKRFYRSMWWVAKVTDLVSSESHTLSHPTLSGAERMVQNYIEEQR